VIERLYQPRPAHVARERTPTGSNTTERPSPRRQALLALGLTAAVCAAAWLLGAGFATLGLVAVAGFAIARAFSRATREVEERRRTEDALRGSEERYRCLIESMADAVFGLDPGGRIVFANPRASVLTGHSIDQLLEMSCDAIVANDSIPRVRSALAAAEMRTAIDSYDITLLHADGRGIPVEVSASPLGACSSGFRGIQWVARDITERKRYESELVYLASHDNLTGLFNRRRFREELESALAHARRDGSSLGVLWFDLDHFKEINDAFGHRAGDEILTAVALMLQRRVRNETVLARLGGDEFALLLPGSSFDRVEAFAARLLQEMRETPVVHGGREICISPSIGVVVFPDHGMTTDELLSRADLAMYHAKEEGRNRYCVYRPEGEWQTELASRFDWSVMIARAIAEDRLLAYAQPIIDLQTDSIDRYELLVRMLGEDGEVIQPGAFLPAAERVGLINEIDRWVVRAAIKRIAASAAAGIRLKLDMNLSGRAFGDPLLVPLLQDELQRTGIDPALLGLEITETAAVVDMAQARQFIEFAKGLGCRVALDDFGSGFSSFYYLRNLPVDSLKIDGSFVRDILTNAQDQHVVRAIVELAAGFGIDVTAEYVQDAETLELLRGFGVRFAQGYHISEPVPLEQVIISVPA
jgi:diguanylate cyclase (GGDEF)-like protein/PAS domain S-box-containing protein